MAFNIEGDSELNNERHSLQVTKAKRIMNAVPSNRDAKVRKTTQFWHILVKMDDMTPNLPTRRSPVSEANNE